MVGLYEEPDKPSNAIDYIKKYLGQGGTTEYDLMKKENDEMKKQIKQLETQVGNMRRQLANEDEV
jgi:D-alanine-D-alanine ligase-like ATP-grasp enzyme|eukprot:scaffold1573_cov132-Chaetoceros_neogracile.AAC.3